jgi:hypothetical protein
MEEPQTPKGVEIVMGRWAGSTRAETAGNWRVLVLLLLLLIYYWYWAIGFSTMIVDSK